MMHSAANLTSSISSLCRIKELLQNFMNETLGSSSDMPSKGGFSFKDTAEDLASDLIRSLVIDVAVNLDFAFGLDLNPLFNSTSTSLVDRIPSPFIQINQFDIMGVIGVNEWSSSLNFGDVEFLVNEAKALLNISSTIQSNQSSAIRIANPSELTALVDPPSADSDRIIFQAGLDVVFPVFLVADFVGIGGRIEFL